MISRLLLLNGKVYTMDATLPRAEAVAIYGARILALGKDDDLRGLARGEGPALSGAEGWRVVDLGGKAVLPGFIDCHLHFLWYALGPSRVLLDGAHSLQATLNRVKRHIEQREPGEWVLGWGWNDAEWRDAGSPSKEDLDRVAPDSPVALTKKDGHVVWANSLALQMAGVDRETPDPPGGRIERDEDTGQPVGVFKEEAMHLIYDAAPLPGPETRQEALRSAISEAQRLGLTGIHDCDGSESLSDYQELLSREDLGLRVFMMIPRENLDEAIKVGLRSGFGNEYLRIGNLKIFSDGTLGSQTAEMLEPFIDQPQNRGIAAITQQELEDLVGRAADAGIACSVHAIGDKANRRVLDVFARQRETGRGTGLRHRIEHVQLLHPTDVPRFKELDIIASMQPIHATSDMVVADRYWGERARWGYAWKSLLNAGTRLAFGSDAPVESLDPLVGIHAAITRQRADREPQGGWYPEERVSVAEAVYGYTLGAAYASGEEKEKGSVTPGKLADLVVLSQDIFDIPPPEIVNTRVVATIFDGKIVYGDDNL
jgi:predicted amidohydrolase YtcJ